MTRQRPRAAGQRAPLSAWEPHLSCRRCRPTLRLLGAVPPRPRSASWMPRREQQPSSRISSARGQLQEPAPRLRRARPPPSHSHRPVFPFLPPHSPTTRQAVTSPKLSTLPINPPTRLATSLPLLLRAQLPSLATSPLLPLFQPRHTSLPRFLVTRHRFHHRLLGRAWIAVRRRVDSRICQIRRRFPRRFPLFLLRLPSPRHQLYD